MPNLRKARIALFFTAFLLAGTHAATNAAHSSAEDANTGNLSGAVTAAGTSAQSQHDATHDAASVAAVPVRRFSHAKRFASDQNRHGSTHAPAHLETRRETESDVGTDGKQTHAGTVEAERRGDEGLDRALMNQGGVQDADAGANPTSSTGEASPGSKISAQVVSSRSANKLARRHKYDGKGTYYRVGMGACGWHNDSDEFVAAISQAQYRGGEYCGRSARVCHAGNCVTVQLVDECPGCTYGSLDLSPAAFRSLAPMRLGVIDISWSFD